MCIFKAVSLYTHPHSIIYEPDCILPADTGVVRSRQVYVQHMISQTSVRFRYITGFPPPHVCLHLFRVRLRKEEKLREQEQRLKELEMKARIQTNRYR